MARAGWCPNAARAALSPPAWPTGNTGLLVCLVAALAAFSTLVAAEPQQGWTVVTDVASAAGVAVTRVGALQQPFARPAPKTLDPQLLPDFLPAFNVLQDVSPEGDNMFTDVAEQVRLGKGRLLLGLATHATTCATCHCAPRPARSTWPPSTAATWRARGA